MKSLGSVLGKKPFEKVVGWTNVLPKSSPVKNSVKKTAIKVRSSLLKNLSKFATLHNCVDDNLAETYAITL